MCYGVFHVADMHVGWVLSIIPFYYFLKLFFLIWLQLPLGPAMGAKVIYNVIVKPLFTFLGPTIKRFTERHADEAYAVSHDLTAGLDDMKASAMSAGTTMFMEQALTKMAKDQNQTVEEETEEEEE